MTNYEVIENDIGGKIIKRTNPQGNDTWIPIDEANSDYQRYLRWLENPDAEESGTL